MRDFGSKRSSTSDRDDKATAAGPGPGKRTPTEMLSATSSPAQRKVDGGDAAVQRKADAAAAMPTAVRPSIADLFGRRAEQFAADVQRKATGADPDTAAVHESAQRGIATSASPLPHLDTIQRAFGRHDVSGIQAHVGGEAATSTREMGAQAYATGSHVVLGEGADLHTVAHEAAHIVQQRRGVQLRGGVGEVGDAYERHADQVADAVVAGESAEGLLDQTAGGRSVGAAPLSSRLVHADTVADQVVGSPLQRRAKRGTGNGPGIAVDLSDVQARSGKSADLLSGQGVKAEVHYGSVQRRALEPETAGEATRAGADKQHVPCAECGSADCECPKPSGQAENGKKAVKPLKSDAEPHTKGSIPKELIRHISQSGITSPSQMSKDQVLRLGQLARSRMPEHEIGDVGQRSGVKLPAHGDAKQAGGTGQPVQRQVPPPDAMQAAGQAAAATAGTMWWLTLVDGPLPVGDILYGVLIAGAAVAAAVTAASAVEQACSAHLTECLENPWQPEWNRELFGPRKDCGACYRECKLAVGIWPSYKCPL